MNISFKEFQPGQALQPYIKTYWTADFNINDEDNFIQSIVPNGCIELIVHMTDEHCYLSKRDRDWNKSPHFTLVGLYPKSYDVLFNKKVRVFGIRFFPDGIQHVFGVTPAEFLSTYEDGIEVLGKDFIDFCSMLRETKTGQEKISLTERYIKRKLHENKRDYDNAHLAMQLIRQSQGLTDYQQLVKEIPISLRQLQRIFKRQYGLTMTDYIRIARINAIYNYMQSSNNNLTELAYDLDFTDQPHFIREFKNFVGVSPTKFTKNRNSFVLNIG